MDAYQDSIHLMPMEVITQLNSLNQTIKEELDLCDTIREISGGIHMILTAADCSSVANNVDDLKHIKPSADAQNFVVEIA